ncbi:MAG: hypothetical protein II575_05985 [Bacteroidales bacterium]|nr:hypothetical protein [Bacteroidales bacterium]
MRKFVILSCLILVVNMLFAQGASKYLVYNETTKTGHTISFHILAGKNYAVMCDDFNPKISENLYPFLSCYLISRKPAGYKFLNVIDRPDEIYVGDVANSKFEKLSRKAIIERSKPDSAFLAVLNEIIAEKYPDSTFVDKPVIMKFTPNIGSERIGDYECTIGKMQITESWSCKIWYTKEINYNWVHHDEFWLVPGTVIRAEYSDGMVYSLESISDSELAVGNNTESVKVALHLFFGR